MFGVFLTLGLLYAAYALAEAPEPVYFNNHVDYYQNTLINRLGNPEGYELAVESSRPRTNLATHSGRTCAIKPGIYVPIEWSCVCWARNITGINVGSIGYAKYHPINTQTPHVGDIVVLAEGPVGHVAAVIAVDDTTITISEANYSYHKVTTRTLLKTYTNIRGFYTLRSNGLPT